MNEPNDVQTSPQSALAREIQDNDNPIAGQVKFWTSLPTDTFDGKRAIFKAMQMADFNGRTIGNTTFAVENILTHPAKQLNEKTGEVEEWQQIVLVDPAGKTLSFGSVGVHRAIGTLIYLFGKPPWKPALNVQLRKMPGKQMGEWYTLDLVKDGG